MWASKCLARIRSKGAIDRHPFSQKTIRNSKPSELQECPRFLARNCTFRYLCRNYSNYQKPQSMAQSKTPNDTATTMTEIVLPNDTNVFNNLRGGKILHWMDVCSAISAGKHTESVVVTAAVDNVSFENPIRLGDVVTINAHVTRAFKTSIEVFLEVSAENIPTGTKYKSNEAFYTFVGLDSNGKPKPAPELLPETEKEKKLFDGALRRRELRLVLAGRLKPENAPHLKELFVGE